jgi:transcriptional regulator with XRE-family HTH domain
MIEAMRKSIHTPEHSALCQELLAIRQRAGLSQRALALILKVPHSWIAKVETGDRRIDLVEFSRFVWACGIEPVAAFERLAKHLPGSRAKGGRK